MKVIRTFVAVLIAPEIRQKIADVQGQVKKLAPDVKWVAPENFHVTLKFLGNVHEDAISDVCTAVDNAAQLFSPFDLSISGLGAFPSVSRARIVWVGTKNGRDQLIALATAVDKNLAQLGFEREDKDFKAHITIGRVKTSRSLGKLAEGIREIDASDMGTQRVVSVAVMQSELLRDGPVYSPLSESKLINT